MTNPAPWTVAGTVVWKSAAVQSLVNNLMATCVPGLEKFPPTKPRTYGEVFDAFFKAGCLFYIHGGSVRDFLNKDEPKDIDVEYSCPKETVRTTCLANYGENFCFGAQTAAYFRVGPTDGSESRDLLEGTNWLETTFNDARAKEFTTNTVSFDNNPTGNAVATRYGNLLDFTGTGVIDTCDKQIRATVQPAQWNEWVFDWKTLAAVKKFNGLSKVARFWKLRAKGFQTAAAFLTFMINTVKTYWAPSAATDNQGLSNVFRMQICAKLLRGKVRYTVPTDRNSKPLGCDVAPLSEALRRKVNGYADALKVDMGADWYKTNIADANMMTFFEAAATGTIHTGYDLAELLPGAPVSAVRDVDSDINDSSTVGRDSMSQEELSTAEESLA